MLHTPLCPAGHLPRKGGDRMPFLLPPITSVAIKALPAKLPLPISRLAGEMSGRTEGGVLSLQHL
ncbi:MAG: lytic murein transglycosylase [Mesorhizobium sp.]|nr:MAG: lytic murein transglycosylase [Mesorhizobium sp.]